MSALRSQMNKDPYWNAVKILINSGCAPDLRVPQKRNFRSGSPRTVTCAPWKNLSNLPYLWSSCSNWAENGPAVLTSKIAHIHKISAQLEQLCQRYGKFDRFFHGAQVTVRGDPDLKLCFWGTLRSGAQPGLIRIFSTFWYGFLFIWDRSVRASSITQIRIRNLFGRPCSK